MSRARDIIEALHPGGWVDDHPAPIVPCRARDKVPLVPWKQYQTKPPTVAQVKLWEQQYHNCNWALLTGKASGIVVLDMDDYPKATVWLENHKVQLPHTATVETSPNKYHYYLRWPGLEVRNFAKKIDGFDFRGDGGYVIAPGSVHPSGHKYDWAQGLSPSEVPIAPCPEWLIKLLRNGQQHAWSQQQGGESTQGAGAQNDNDQVAFAFSFGGVDYEIPMSEYERRMIEALAAGVPQGGRNHTGFCLGLWFLDNGFPQKELYAMLRQWNDRNTPPMDDKEVKKLSLSILKHWNYKRQHSQRSFKTADDRQRGLAELSNLIGVEILDVYQIPDEAKGITIVARQGDRTAVAYHATICGYRSWAMDFARQTLMVPILPEKVSAHFTNHFMRLLFGCTRILPIDPEATTEGVVLTALQQMVESGTAASTREAAGIKRDERNRKFFQMFWEGGALVFHLSELLENIDNLTRDYVSTKEVVKIIERFGAKKSVIRIHEGRARAWFWTPV